VGVQVDHWKLLFKTRRSMERFAGNVSSNWYKLFMVDLAVSGMTIRRKSIDA
jgi:hypothetical protein